MKEAHIAVVAPAPRMALAVGELAVRALAGLVLGTLLAAIAAGIVFELLAVVTGVRGSDAWLLRCACAGGVVGAVWLARRAPRPRVAATVARRPRPVRERHGWVDAVFRIGLGMTFGAFAMPCAVLVAMVWLGAFGVRDRVVDVFGSLGGFGVFFSPPFGALLGGLWFGLDGPWFRHRRAA